MILLIKYHLLKLFFKRIDISLGSNMANRAALTIVLKQKISNKLNRIEEKCSESIGEDANATKVFNRMQNMNSS